VSNRLFLHIVSADGPFCERLRALLSDSAECCFFEGAEACLAELARHTPDAVIIDASMADDAGFRLHRTLRDDFDHAGLYQILLCPPDMIGREGLAPDDLLVLPASDALIALRLSMLEKRIEEQANTRAQMSYAQNVAFTSMSAMGELGVVMQFLSKSFACHNVQAVARLAVDALCQYELAGAVYLVWEGDHHVQTTSGDPLSEDNEALILQRRTLGRVLEIERNLVVNFDHVSVLVTNLPEDDAARLGRIRDNIATLTEGIESRIQGLLLEHDNLLKQQGIRYAVNEIRDSVIDLDARQMTDLMQTRALVNELIDEFGRSFHHMSLHAEHENLLIGDLVELRTRIGDIVGKPGEVHQRLKSVVDALQTLAGEMQR